MQLLQFFGSGLSGSVTKLFDTTLEAEGLGKSVVFVSSVARGGVKVAHGLCDNGS